MKRAAILTTSLLLLLSSGIGFWAGRLTAPAASSAQDLLRVEAENQQLKARLEDLSRANAASAREADEGGGTGSRGKRSPRLSEGSSAADLEVIRNLQEKLAVANEAASVARARIEEIEKQLSEMREESARLAALNRENEVNAASAKLELANRDNELTRKGEQITQMEATNRKAIAESGVLAQKATRQADLLKQLQELHRRRESYLNTMVSRYRDITDRYRAYASVLENRRGPEGTPGAGISIAGPELGQIQTSITLAEEDLRQLTSLSAQVAKLQKDLSAK
jgi:DNA repair exonuclease SbcCD ATPase subunit